MSSSPSAKSPCASTAAHTFPSSSTRSSSRRRHSFPGGTDCRCVSSNKDGDGWNCYANRVGRKSALVAQPAGCVSVYQPPQQCTRRELNLEVVRQTKLAKATH